MHLYHDFHPDEATVRIFRTPEPGVLRLDDTALVTEAIYNQAVLRHYAFADHWFKINVTTDLAGVLVETGEAPETFAFNCDIATPMEREGSSTFAVDLFIDLLVRVDTRSYVVKDEEEFETICQLGLLSASEAEAARQAVHELLDLVSRERLLPWLNEVTPFGPCHPPEGPPMDRGLVPERLLPAFRRTW